MKNVPKRVIRILKEPPENAEFEHMKIILELCRESDDDLWRQLMLTHIENMRILNSEEGSQIKEEIRRKLKYEV